jgi:hypothetical protein
VLNVEHLMCFENRVNRDIGAVLSPVFEKVPELVDIVLGELHVDASAVDLRFVGFVEMFEGFKDLAELQEHVHNESVSPVKYLLLLFLIFLHLQSLLPCLLNLILNPFHLINRQLLIVHLPLQRHNLIIVHLVESLLVLDSGSDLAELDFELGVLVLELEALLGLAVESLLDLFLFELELFETFLGGLLVLELHFHCLDVVLGCLYLFGFLLYCLIEKLLGDVRVVVQVGS